MSMRLLEKRPLIQLYLSPNKGFNMISLLYVILAILGLSFLIFIHELGHYYVARRTGMRVETFSIGFGRPIYSWMKDGVRWQIGWLLFGGYVKIAGMDTDEKDNIFKMDDGFFEKPPIARIKVAFAGPFVNIVFAVLMFAALWSFGGRQKNFSEFTHKIGWVDPHSEIYKKGIRPGDELVSYNGVPYQSSKDNIIAAMMSPGDVEIEGNHIDFNTKKKVPYHFSIKPYPHPSAIEKDILTTGILDSASYVIYDRLPNGQDNPLPKGSPMQDSGIEYGDRIVWVDGEPIYSAKQLSTILNDSRALLTIQRGNQVFLSRVPRVTADELRIDPKFKEELIDWQYEAQLKGLKLQKLYTLPYAINNECVVERPIRFIDKENEEAAFPTLPFSNTETPLLKGDKILAIDGIPVIYSYEILSHLQQHHVNIVVERLKHPSHLISWRQADAEFDQQFNPADLTQITTTIGLSKPVMHAGNLVLLDSVVPKMRKDFDLTPENQAVLAQELMTQQKEIESIDDPEKRAKARQIFDSREKQYVLGLPAIQDQTVSFNPNPLALFYQVFEEIWHTLKALFTGSLNPKWMSGPIGIVQVVHDNSMSNWKEGIYWLGAISLNLGFLNLLPVPVLDGGTICFSLYEWLTGRKLKPKTIEKLVIPFALLLIGFFIFLTYHDLTRLLRDFLP